MIRRPLGIVSAALIFGIISQYLFSFSLVKIIASLIVIIIAFIYYIFKKNNKNYLCILLLFVTCLGCLIAKIELNNGGQFNRFIDKEVDIYGYIIQKNVGDHKEYYLFAKEVIYKDTSHKIEEKLLLRVPDNSSDNNFENKIVFLRGIVEEPQEARNPKLFNYKLYLKNRGIYSIIFSQKDKIKTIGDTHYFNSHYVKSHIKNYIYNNFQDILNGNEGTLALSIVFGDKSIIEKDIYESFKKSGVAHVLAVSGLHFGILFIFINSILSRLNMKKSHTSTILIVIIWCFAFLSGYPISGIRAAAMLTIYVLSQFFDRRYDLFAALFFIVILTLMVKPLIIFDIGFQLSFGAVISIGMFYSTIYEKLNYLPAYFNRIISASLSAQIGIAPLLAYHFNIFTPWALIFNIPIIFITGYILPITLLLFISIPTNEALTYILATVDAHLIKILIYITRLSNYLPYSSITLASPRIHFLVVYYCLIALMVYKDRIKFLSRISIIKIVCFFLSIYMTINVLILTYPKELKVTFIDVGQGDCALIETPQNRKILIDGGNFKENNLLTQFLLKNHINNIDLVFLSHNHNDHIGGVFNVIDSIKVDRVLIGTDKFVTIEWLDFQEKCKERGIPIMNIYKGDELKIENDLWIDVLGPPDALIDGNGDDTNNNSLVLLLTYKEMDFLFTGDIEKRGEDLLLFNNIGKDIEILKVAHHGSKEATSKQFLKKYLPEIAVIQVGKNNYGHPNKEVINRLKDEKIKIYRNDDHGAVIIETNGYKAKILKTIGTLE